MHFYLYKVHKMTLRVVLRFEFGFLYSLEVSFKNQQIFIAIQLPETFSSCKRFTFVSTFFNLLSTALKTSKEPQTLLYKLTQTTAQSPTFYTDGRIDDFRPGKRKTIDHSPPAQDN